MNLPNYTKSKRTFQILQAFLASLFGSAVLCMLVKLWYLLKYINEAKLKDILLQSLRFPTSLYFFGVLLLFFVFLLWNEHGTVIGRILYQYRFLIAATLWILCIVFKINSTSMASWGNFFSTDLNARGLVLGVNRGIRADEWATYTPMMLSQQYGANGAYPYFSQILRGTATDTFIVYGLPVKDIAILFRPFHWGFLFLGAEYGFSFYWCGRIIALAVVSFEFGLLITKNNKLYAFMTALLLTLSPTVQWWIGVNGLVEMMVFSLLSVLLLYRYMHTENYKIRILCGLLLVICAGGFILVFYPAWQIPLAYITLGLLVWVILESWKEFHFQPRKDIPLAATCLLLLGGGMAYIFLKSFDAVNAVLNTAYPGNRIDCGGGEVFQMLRYAGTLFFPFLPDTLPANLPGNQCELSVFISFAPLGLILTLFILLKEKKADLLLISLLTVNVFLHSFMILRYPSTLAQITLLSRTMPRRITEVIGIIDILMLFRALTLLKTRFHPFLSAIISIVTTIGIIFVNRTIYGTYLSSHKLYVLSIILFLGYFLLLHCKETHLKVPTALYISILLFISGGLVNPIQHGFDIVYETDLMKEVRRIVNEDPEGLWICDSIGYPMNNYFIMGGARTIDSINTYPVIERWELLDPNGYYKEIYNRYAHITTILQKDNIPTRMDIGQAQDSFTLSLNMKDLEKLQVSYVASNRDLTEFGTRNITFEQIASAQNYCIFRVKYNIEG